MPRRKREKVPKEQQPLRLRREHLVHQLKRFYTESTYKQRNDLVISVFDALRSILQSGCSICISNFGTFKIQEIGPRAARNINTGEAIRLAPMKRVVFIPTHSIKMGLNPGGVRKMTSQKSDTE